MKAALGNIHFVGYGSTQLLSPLLIMKIKKSAAKAAMIPQDTAPAASAAKTVAPTPRTTSAAPAPSMAPKAPAAPPGSVASAVAAAPVAPPPHGAVTTIDVKMDVGFGNVVFLRGQGGGLTWERGVPLNCVDGKTWRWSGTVKDPVTFKPLINDHVWSAGSDLTVKPGQKVEVKPSFD